MKKSEKKEAGSIQIKADKVRFAAIDFETADYERDSACSLSIVLVEGGRISRQISHLIRPPRKDFVFTYIHGIGWRDVAHRPTFGELWTDFAEMLKDLDFIAAHNAKFDKSVMAACCARSGTRMPDFPFLCTVNLARDLWGVRPTKLPDVCRHLKIALNHHDATSDALACAQIVMAALREDANLQGFLS